jgi:hypothetical protein
MKIQATLDNKFIKIYDFKGDYRYPKYRVVRNFYIYSDKIYQSDDWFKFFYKNRLIAYIDNTTLSSKNTIKINVGSFTNASGIINGVKVNFDELFINKYIIRFSLFDTDYNCSFFKTRDLI